MAIISPNPADERIVFAVHFAALPASPSRERLSQLTDELLCAFPDMYQQPTLPLSPNWGIHLNSRDGASTIRIQDDAFTLGWHGRVAPEPAEFGDSIKPAFADRFDAFSNLVNSRLGAGTLQIDRCELTYSRVIEEPAGPPLSFGSAQQIAEDLRLNWQFIAHPNPAIANPEAQTRASVLEITASGPLALNANLMPGGWFEWAYSEAVNTARKLTELPDPGRLDDGAELELPVRAPSFDSVALQAYRRRIEELRGYGQEDDVVLNPASERDFLAFIQTLPGSRRAGLALTDDGTLRAAWDDDNDGETHLGVEFLGQGRTVYVIFRRRPGAEKVTSVADTADFAGIQRQITAFDLQYLV